ncbi:hypothetical protein PPACK8108_LOCUS9431 [Phakopsora pachyrhizi]|uniref:Uncharacterized protein n=1 Tax=Phakopsora pachyrhizi TaxID=170000 RepID=A0AAV0AZT7_PHAPC|nr:hypothetical protein PPACK8108_LOCUS9431 [Phakopsora pachyrhizi]
MEYLVIAELSLGFGKLRLLAQPNSGVTIDDEAELGRGQDKADREEDLAALPILIAKSQRNKEVLRRFEVDLALHKQEKSKTDNNDHDND